MLAQRIGALAFTSTSTDTTLVIGAGVTIPVGARIAVSYCSNDANTDGTPTAFDSKGNTGDGESAGFYHLEAEQSGAARRVLHFSAEVSVALTTGDTITVHNPVGNARRTIDVIQLDGVDAPIAAPAIGTNGSSTAVASGATGSRIRANSVVIGVTGWNSGAPPATDTFVADAPFGNENMVVSTGGAASRYLDTAWWMPSTNGTEGETGTLNVARNWSELVVPYPERQAIVPAGDVSHGGWVNEAGSQANLFASVDEAPAPNAADWIESQPVELDVCSFTLAAAAMPGSGGTVSLVIAHCAPETP